MRVLLIEDDEATAASLRLLFSSEGIVCDTVESGEEGLEVSRLYNHYDIVILDLMLPDMNGYEVLYHRQIGQYMLLKVLAFPTVMLH